MNLYFIPMAMLLIAPGDPPTVSVSEDIVTLNADIAWINDYQGEVTLLQGTVLTGNLWASTDGEAPIILKLQPGEYLINAYGYPVDRMFPARAEAVLPVVINSPSRIKQIQEVLVRFSIATFELSKAKQDLADLAPTNEEIRTAILSQ